MGGSSKGDRYKYQDAEQHGDGDGDRGLAGGRRRS